MKIQIKIAVISLLAFCLPGLAFAASAVYASAGKSLNSSWQTVSLPAGAVVKSVATAEAIYMQGPAAYYGATLPSGRYWSASLVVTAPGVITATVTVWPRSQAVSFGGAWDTNPQPSSGYAAVGIAGPPAGLVHEARAITTGGLVTDEKTSTLAGGIYYIYHGGGISGNGSVTGFTEITW